jgi:hypothetical protein
MKNNYIFLLLISIMAVFVISSLAHAASTGGGSSSPSVTVYSNGSQTGYQLANLTAGNSETLNFNNNTKTTNITINFITPTSVGITANNQTYGLTVGNPVALVDPNSYTGYAYYAELTNISYPDVTLLVYGQPPSQPAAAVNITTTIIAPKNVTAQKQPITTVPTTTVPVSTTVAVPALSVSLSSNNYLIAAIILVIVVLVLVYYNNAKNRKNK